MGFQIVHAATGMQQTDFRLGPSDNAAAELPVTGNATVGSIGPTPPFFGFSAAELGAASDAQVTTYLPPGDTFATSTTKLSAAFANGSVTAADVADGKSFALIAVGAYPGLPAGGWWHALTYTIVPTDPP